MKLDLIKTSLTQKGILTQIPSEILDPLEVELINCYKRQVQITDQPTLRSLVLDLQKLDGIRELATEIKNSRTLDKAETEIALFKVRSMAVNKLVLQFTQLEIDDEVGRQKLQQRITELNNFKKAQWEDPVNALNWEKLTKAEMDEIHVQIDWLEKNDVSINKKVLYSFIATTNGGKTILKTWIAHHLLKVGSNVLYLAQEEPYSDTIRRIYQSTLNITESQYKTMTQDGFKEVGEAYQKKSEKLGYGNIYVAEWAGIEVSSIEEWIKQHNEIGPHIDAVVVDYGKLVETSNKTSKSQEWERIGLIFKELKQLAMRLNVAVITSIQLNREASQKLIEKGETADLYDVAGAYEATHHVNYCWSVRLQEKPSEDVDYEDPTATLGMYTLTVQKQKYGKLRKGDMKMFHWKTDHTLEEINVDQIDIPSF